MTALQHIGTALKGRKVLAYCITSILVFLAGTLIPTDKLPTVVTGLLAAYSALVVGHTISDVKSAAKTEAK